MWNVKVTSKEGRMHMHSEGEGIGIDIVKEMVYAVSETLQKIECPKEVFMLLLLKDD